MSDPVARLNAALEGRYAIERELGDLGTPDPSLFFQKTKCSMLKGTFCFFSHDRLPVSILERHPLASSRINDVSPGFFSRTMKGIEHGRTQQNRK